MEKLLFSLQLRSPSSPEQIVDEVGKVLNLQLKPSECDWYDGDPVWETHIFRMHIELHYFPEDKLFYLDGDIDEKSRSLIDPDMEPDPEVNDISKSITTLFQIYAPQSDWKISYCIECIALVESKKLYQSPPLVSYDEENDDLINIKVFEPHISFIHSWLKRAEGTSLCLAASFWEFVFDRDIESFPSRNLTEWFLNYESLYEHINYQTTLNSTEPITLKTIDDPLSELAKLLSNQGFGTPLSEEKARGIAAEFILQFHLADGIYLKGQTAWNKWFACDGYDYFYVIVKGSRCWILSFSESD
ncbi:MAG: hypothetical protein PF637_11470 [Spirochaetes bacterium]|jgi:hypothetical protein|nr:hypothetical protein [Spirochaetota bacterium]